MKNLHAVTAILCIMLLIAPAGLAQQYSWQKQEHSWLTDPYQAKTIPPIDLTNSERLEKLLRAGRLYLSLNDAIALALENNLDIELQRYGPQIAQADLLRANAGGLLRGVPQTVQVGPESIESQATGTAGGTTTGGIRPTTGTAAGGTGGGIGADTVTTEAGGAVITQTGVATPVLDPQLFFRYGYSHRSSPQSNTITTGGVSSFIFDNQAGNFGVQKNWLTGTTASFGWNNNYSQTNNLASTLNPYFSGNWQLQFTQRLLQGWGKR